MDFDFSEEQETVRELSRRLFADACSPERLAALERDDAGGGIDGDLLATLSAADLLGVAVPAEHGGGDLGLIALLILLEEAGRALAPVPLLPSLVLGALPVARFGTAAQRGRWLPGVVAGQHGLTAGLDEIGQADATRPRHTYVYPSDDGLRLEGEKISVPGVGHAARILVPASTADGGVEVVLVDPRQSGVHVEPGLGHAHERLSRVRFEDVRLGEDDRLGGPQAGADVTAYMVEHARLGVAALSLGIAEEALRRTAEYTAARKQFGRAIATFQAVTMRCADAYVDLECMRSTLWQAAWRLDAGLPATREVAAAKWWACRGAHRVVHTAQHLHGGTGADVDYPIHRYFLRAMELELVGGGAGVQLATIGASLAGD